MALKPVPQELAQLIDRVNCLPRERKGIYFHDKTFPVIPLDHWNIGEYRYLPRLQETCEQIMQVLKEYPEKDYPEFTTVTGANGVRQVCMDVIRMKEFPSKFPEYKTLFSKYRQVLVDFSRTCEELSEAKRVLHIVAGLSSDRFGFNYQIDARVVNVPTNFAQTPDDRLKLFPSRLTELLLDIEGISRIRICRRASCRRLFWAGRRTSTCCSTKCFQSLWKKKKSLTIDPEERRKKQRDYKRQYRETLKKMRRKNETKTRP